MMAVSSTPVAMDVSSKPKLRFSIDVLMGKDSEKRSPPSSPSPDYRRNKISQEEPVAHPKIPTPQVPIYRRDSIVIPVPTFPSGTPVSSLNAATTVTSSRNRPTVGLMSSTPAGSIYPRSAPTHCNIQHNGPLEPIPAMFLHGDAFPSFPLLLARQRFLPHGFGPGPDIPGYLLHPYRKPKRIRTAFSANQLMKLEGAFDKNHYVTGNERKQLADSLGLSETQGVEVKLHALISSSFSSLTSLLKYSVNNLTKTTILLSSQTGFIKVKVWFQNRRTKQKRQVLEEKERSGRSSHTSLTTTPDSFSREMSSHSPPMRSPSPSADVNITEDEDDDKLSSNNESYDEQTS